AALMITAVAAAGCGRATPTAHTSSPQGAPTSAAPMMASAQLDSVLLTVADVNTAMGASDMQPTSPIEHATWTVDRTLSNLDCRAAFFVAEAAVYQGSGYTAVSAQGLHEVGDDPHHRVGQAAVTFPSADLAVAFVRASAAKWRACAGQTITAHHMGRDYLWTVGNLGGDVPAITQPHTLEGGNGYTCRHALRAVVNVVLDVNACAYQLGDQASQIADKMAATVTRQAH
ncbi:sensor domain-containing protein, partial [Mycobacterium palustre]